MRMTSHYGFGAVSRGLRCVLRRSLRCCSNFAPGQPMLSCSPWAKRTSMVRRAPR